MCFCFIIGILIVLKSCLLFFLGSEYDKLNKMMDSLDLHYEPKLAKYVEDLEKKKEPSGPPIFYVGDHVAAVWETDQLWYRGVVKSLHQEKKYEVFFFDYGDTVCVMEPYIWPLHPKFCVLPKQAIKAKLSGRTISPLETRIVCNQRDLKVSCLPTPMTRPRPVPGPSRPPPGCSSSLTALTRAVSTSSWWSEGRMFSESGSWTTREKVSRTKYQTDWLGKR